MKYHSVRQRIHEIFGITSRAAMGAGIVGCIIWLGMQAHEDDIEAARLESLATFTQDGASYKLAGENAVAMSIFMTSENPNNKDDRAVTFRDGYIFDLDDKNVIRMNENGKDNTTNLIPFDRFANPDMVERARKSGCALAENVIAHGDDSDRRHYKQERTDLITLANNFAAGHCAPVRP